MPQSVPLRILRGFPRGILHGSLPGRLFVPSSSFVLLCLALTSVLSAQPVSAQTANLGSGVVVVSFSERANAMRRVSELRNQAIAKGISLSVLPSESVSRPLFRVVAQSNAMQSRQLLNTLRNNGFADAWHIRSASLRSPALITENRKPVQPGVLSNVQTKVQPQVQADNE